MSFIRRTLVALLAAAGLAVHATDFRSTDIHPDGYPTVDAVKYMGTVLNKLSGAANTRSKFSTTARSVPRRTRSSRPRSGRSR